MVQRLYTSTATFIFNHSFRPAVLERKFFELTSQAFALKAVDSFLFRHGPHELRNVTPWRRSWPWRVDIRSVRPVLPLHWDVMLRKKMWPVRSHRMASMLPVLPLNLHLDVMRRKPICPQHPMLRKNRSRKMASMTIFIRTRISIN